MLDSNLLGILSDEFDPWTMMESSPALDLGLRMGMASFGSIKLQTRKIDGDKQDMDLPVTWDGREGHVCNAFDRDQFGVMEVMVMLDGRVSFDPLKTEQLPETIGGSNSHGGMGYGCHSLTEADCQSLPGVLVFSDECWRPWFGCLPNVKYLRGIYVGIHCKLSLQVRG